MFSGNRNRVVGYIAILALAFLAMPSMVTGEPKAPTTGTGTTAAPRPYPWGLDPGTPTPTEPPTRTISPEEADNVLVRDWLFQVDNRPTEMRIAQEIEWTRALAARIAKAPQAPNLSALLARLDGLDNRCRKHLQAKRQNMPVPDGLLARWTMDGVEGQPLEAIGPAAAPGELTGADKRLAGMFGEALVLDRNGYVDVGRAAAHMAKKPYTISAWIKTASGAADIVGNGTTTGCVLLMVYRNVLRGHHWTGKGLNVLDGKTRISDGRWHHVAQVVDGKHIRLYVDGRLDAEQPFKGDLVSADQPLTIGRRNAARLQESFAGALDEICLFDRALPQDEINRMAESGGHVDPEVQELYLEVRRLKRRIALANPVLDFDSVMFIDQPYPAGREWPHEARHRNGIMAVGGGRLLVLKGLHPGGQLRKLAPTSDQGPSAFWRPDLSFDARRALFCMKPAGDKSLHLYEVALNGTGMRQLTASEYDDLDPVYLPDGKILFSTSRANTYVRCMPYTYCYVLARCDSDGRNIYIVSQGNEPDYTPALLNDGRVVYTRWEYTDKALWRIQSLWTINPDGTNGFVFWGNQSVWPDLLVEARPIPGSKRVMFTGAAHHDWFAGSIGIVEPAQGLDFPHGLSKVTADVPWPECGTPPVDPIESQEYHTSGAFTAYKSPWPLSETDFLVSARTGPVPSPRDKKGLGHFKLYLMDVFGNRELIYEGQHNIMHAIPVRPRSAPVVPDRVAWPKPDSPGEPVAEGVFYSADIYQNAPLALRDKARYLRVIQMDSRTYSSWERDPMPHQHAGPTISLVQADGVKRILGTVPIAEDGSVQFQAPPGKALHFQLLDENHKALQTMRSFTGVMPGERRGCVGCHEMHSTTPINAYGTSLGQAPARLDPPAWGAETTIGYERMVQPVLERHCAKCHSGDHEARAKFDVTLRPGQGIFKEPYVTLVGGLRYHGNRSPHPEETIAGVLPVEEYPRAGTPETVQTIPPMHYLSYGSRLINHYATPEHYDVKVPDNDLQVLMAWIDLACPYRGDEEVREMADPDFPGIDDLPVRPRLRTAPAIDRFRLRQDTFPRPEASAGLGRE